MVLIIACYTFKISYHLFVLCFILFLIFYPYVYTLKYFLEDSIVIVYKLGDLLVTQNNISAKIIVFQGTLREFFSSLDCVSPGCVSPGFVLPG
jgi:hypothetical protein